MEAQMFPPEGLWPRYAERAVRTHPKAGDLNCRSALTLHRGTEHPSPIARPVLVLGVDAPGAGHAGARARHLVCRVVDSLVPVTQKHASKAWSCRDGADKAP